MHYEEQKFISHRLEVKISMIKVPAGWMLSMSLYPWRGHPQTNLSWVTGGGSLISFLERVHVPKWMISHRGPHYSKLSSWDEVLMNASGRQEHKHLDCVQRFLWHKPVSTYFKGLQNWKAGHSDYLNDQLIVLEYTCQTMALFNENIKGSAVGSQFQGWHEDLG